MLKSIRYPLTATCLILVGICGRPSPLDASPLFFTDRSAFDRAVGAFDLFDFDNIDPCPEYNPATFTCTQTYGPLKFNFDIAGVPRGPELSLGIGGQAFSTFLSSPVTALGFDVVRGTPGSLLTVGLFSTDGSFDVVLSGTVPAFFGVFFPDAELTGLFLGVGPPASRPVVSIDNLALQSVPEPATLLLFGSAALVLVRVRHRFGART